MKILCPNGHDVTSSATVSTDETGRRIVRVSCSECGTTETKHAACPVCAEPAPMHARWCDAFSERSTR